MKTNKYNKNGYIIRISENAIIQMILSGLEAYNILHPIGKINRRKIETYGLLWGHEISLQNKKTFYCIDMLSIDTSAERHKSMVSPNDSALELKENILTSFWPQYEFLGDFHTHPEDHYADVKPRNYQFSNGDYNSIQYFSEYWQKYNYRVGIVLTIAMLEKKGTKEACWKDSSTVEFTLGNCRLWLKGYITYTKNNKMHISSHNDANVPIDCPSILGLFGEHTPFSRA
jgi:hypothetical protein